MMSALAVHWHGGFVALCAALIWVAHHDRWTLASWQLPTDYVGDAHELLARIKAASEGDTVPLQPQVISRLGAPFGAHWNAYPTPDKPLILVLGGIARFIGLHATANLALVLAQVAAALAFFYVARWLRCRWEWAAAGALLFAYTYHTFHRGLAHFSLLLIWTVPLGLLAVALVASSRRLDWGRPGALLCLAAALALGVSNPYNLFFCLQLLGWAVLLQFLGARRRANLQIGIACLVVALIAFFAVHAEYWLHADDTEALPLLARNYSGTERYALKAVEMFIPPSFHRWDWLAFFGNRYTRWSEWRGEPFLPYLGLAGIVAAIWLSFTALKAVVRRQRLPGQTLSIGWIVAYSAIGGFTNLLALFVGFQIFRATNRAAIFVSAILLTFLVLRLSRLTAGWSPWLRGAAALLVGGLGVYEQLPRTDTRWDLPRIAQHVRNDAAFGQALEQEFAPGSMLFQLPVLGFPEVVAPHQLVDYEHFRPYLATDTLRFSYGAPKFRARSRWQRDLEGLPVARVVERLEAYGFAGLYLNRKGFQDRAEPLLRELAELGYTRRIESPGGNQVVVVLRPAPEPQLPLGSMLTAGRGWHLRTDGGVRWAYEDGALSYFNPHSHPIEVNLRLTLVAASPRNVMLDHEGSTVSTLHVAGEPQSMLLPRLRLRPGINRFLLRSDAPALRGASGPSRQLRAVGLKESVVERAAAPGPLESLGDGPPIAAGPPAP